MADMIALRGAFTYRTDTISIPGYPAIQPDDQVRIYERTTSEGFLHYVDTIQSSNDLTKGQWTYELSTHWLGDNPNEVWAFKSEDFTPPTKQIISAWQTAPGMPLLGLRGGAAR